MTDKIYGVQEISALTGFHRQTLMRHLKSGKIEAFKIGNRFFMNQSQLNKMFGK